MRQGSNTTLYILVGLLIGAGLLILVFRSQLFNLLSSQIGSGEVASSSVTVAPKDTIDPDLLKSKTFASLTNYVLNFDFDNICWRPDSATKLSQPVVAQVGTSTDEASSTPAVLESINCRLGNDIPFALKKKK